MSINSDDDDLRSIEAKIRNVALSVSNTNNNINDLLQKFKGTYTITTSSVSSSGTIPAGAVAVVFHLSNTFVGSINGVSHNGTEKMIVKYQAQQGLTLPAISYTITTGSMFIEIATKV